MHRLEDLNDLRLVALIAEYGSLSGAARRLGVNHATVFRRLVKLEERLGTRLFEREGGRYHANAAGEELAAAGATIDETADQALLRVVGRDLHPSGHVRITTTDSVALTLLPPLAAECRRHYPQISLSVNVDDHLANLSRRDADIAIRPTTQPPDYLVGKRIAPLRFAIYGSQDYLAARSTNELADHDWIALDDSYTGHRTLRWLEGIKPLDRVGYRTSSFGLMQRSCRAGLGLALLPSILGETDPALRRLGVPVAECGSELWLLVHPDLRHTERVKSVFQLLFGGLQAAMTGLPQE